MVIDLHREIVKLKLQLGERDKQLEAVTRERNLFKAKYTELKQRLHLQQQRAQEPLQLASATREDALSLQIAMQLQEEEKQRAERHRRRAEARHEHMEEQLLIQRAIEESKQASPLNPDVMSYEELLALSEKLGSVSKGLAPEDIERMPSYFAGASKQPCTVCYEPMKPGDRAKRLQCQHEYHAGCIDSWLAKEKRCPVCN